MRTIRISAKQGHEIPTHVYDARGPFAPVNVTVTDIEYDPDWFPPGATAQNNMQGVPVYECRGCGVILLDHEIDQHECEGEE